MTMPAGRYGVDRPRRRPGVVIAVGLLAAAFVGWVVWAALGAAAPKPSGQVTGFRVEGPNALRVSVVLGGPAGRVSCAVQALDASHEVVGVTNARARVGSSGRARTSVVVRTRVEAVAAQVDGCVLAAD
jgi:hypothetical protein